MDGIGLDLFALRPMFGMKLVNDIHVARERIKKVWLADFGLLEGARHVLVVVQPHYALVDGAYLFQHLPDLLHSFFDVQFSDREFSVL